MAKKSSYSKRRLGKMLKRSRRMPILAVMRTHRRAQQNMFNRNWRSKKLKFKDDNYGK
jgi:ribosomal protein L39E